MISYLFRRLLFSCTFLGFSAYFFLRVVSSLTGLGYFDFSKMPSFEINYEVNKWNSEFFLNNNWSIRLKIEPEIGNLFLNVDLEYHGLASSETMLIYADISISTFPQKKIYFSNYDRINSKCIHLAKLCVQAKIDFFTEFRLHGNITIESKNEKCASFMQKGKSDVQPKSLVKLSNDFEQLLHLQEPSFSDVTLSCRNVSIPAHKIILSARSPYFAAMFKHPMKENLENKVCITDLDIPVFQAMMKYIYSGKTSRLNARLASDLLLAADKYQLEDLKEECCDFLKSNTTLKNVCSIIVLGDRLEEGLKSFGVDYISKNCKDFSAFEHTKEWKNLKAELPILAIDVLSSLMKIKEKK